MSNKLFPEQKDEKKPNPSRKPPKNKPGRLFTPLFVLLAILFFMGLISEQYEKSLQMKVSYTEFFNMVENNRQEPKISHVQLGEGVADVTMADGSKFSLTVPANDNDLIKALRMNVENFTVKESNMFWLNVISLMWPLFILGMIIWFAYRGSQGSGNKLFSFGKSRVTHVGDKQVKVTFNDVAGVDEAKEELQEIIEFLKDPKKFQRLGGKIPKGVLLMGPPGTGKTLLAKAVAGEAGVPFLSISGSDFVEMFVGVGASRVRDLFEQAKKASKVLGRGSIIFIDEIDAVGRQRFAGVGGGHDEREQTLNALLVEMDGFNTQEGIILMAATNRPDVLDPALLRPGRFDRQVVVDRPDVKGREGILKVHTRNIPPDPDVDLKVLAKGTPGLSGADLANLVNEAALLAARMNKSKVTMLDFEEAKDKVMMGTERKSLIISESEKKLTSYHEIGHVLVARMIPDADPVHKVTIIPRGRALGVTTYLPVDEKHTYAKDYLEATITYALGGRAAEKLIFNKYTTGAGNDIEKATSLARKMVCEWGMSEKLGPLAYGQKDEEIFLGREIQQHKDYSEKTAQEIDEEIRSIVTSCMERAERILSDNIEILHKLSLELLDREILDAEEIDKIINGEELPPLKKIDPVPENDPELQEEGVPSHVKDLMEKRNKDKSGKDGDTELRDQKDNGENR
jgi:cell division protease FtsH